MFDARPETPEAKLLKFIREQFPNFKIVKIPRRHFSDADGMDMLKKFCSDKYDSVRQSVESKYYALSAVAGLLKYLAHFYNINFIEQSLKIEFETKYGHMLIGNLNHSLE